MNLPPPDTFLFAFLATMCAFWVVMLCGPGQRIRRATYLERLELVRSRLTHAVEMGRIDPTDPQVRFLFSLLNFDRSALEQASSLSVLRWIWHKMDAWSRVRREELEDDLGQIRDALTQLAECSKRNDLKPYLREYLEAWGGLCTTFTVLMVVGLVAVTLKVGHGAVARLGKLVFSMWRTSGQELQPLKRHVEEEETIELKAA